MLLDGLKRRGITTVCTASTGNLGLGVACAADWLGMNAIVCVPNGANETKVNAIAAYGAEVIMHGRDFDEARAWIEARARVIDAYYVSTADDHMIIGAATYALELLLEHPTIDNIVVPIGGGSGASGTAIVAAAIDPTIRVIGVQSKQAPAMQHAWSGGGKDHEECSTYAEGIATRVPFDNTMNILKHGLDDFVLVDDADLLRAQAILWNMTRQHVEAAAAAPLAAVMQDRRRYLDTKTALILTGGNVSASETRRVADRQLALPANQPDRIADMDVGRAPDQSTAERDHPRKVRF